MDEFTLMKLAYEYITYSNKYIVIIYIVIIYTVIKYTVIKYIVIEYVEYIVQSLVEYGFWSFNMHIIAY